MKNELKGDDPSHKTSLSFQTPIAKLFQRGPLFSSWPQSQQPVYLMRTGRGGRAIVMNNDNNNNNNKYFSGVEK